jgi:hypothetical protein
LLTLQDLAFARHLSVDHFVQPFLFGGQFFLLTFESLLQFIKLSAEFLLSILFAIQFGSGFTLGGSVSRDLFGKLASAIFKGRAFYRQLIAFSDNFCATVLQFVKLLLQGCGRGTGLQQNLQRICVGCIVGSSCRSWRLR